MKIKDILMQEKPVLSLEVYPPKKEELYEPVDCAIRKIADLRPDFMSVTYGAGGGTSRYTIDIASNLSHECGITALVHLSCISSTKGQIRDMVSQIKARGIENILALRGDIPETGGNDYKHASDLICDLKELGDFCIGGACYPAGHPESANMEEDLCYLKEKVDVGCDFLTTQMFFDNDIFYRFLYQARGKGITVPILAGIMPVTSARLIGKSVTLSGSFVPKELETMIAKYSDNKEDMRKAGTDYAVRQILDLKEHGVDGIHIYTMNRPKTTAEIVAQMRRNTESAN